MNWALPTLAAVAALHVIAVVIGRPTGSLRNRIAFASGILGLLSIPLVIVIGLMSLCIAGGCGHGGIGAIEITAIVFVLIALSSLISLIVIGTHRPRA
jgi:hypothetical protein